MGDASHSFGFHLANPPAGDYSLAGEANRPVGNYSCAIDISMSWPVSRDWLTWLITEIREDRIIGIAEVIGSFDGKDVRYWSDVDTPQWQQAGVPYTGEGHDTWTHVAIYRSSAQIDHQILAGWTATGHQGDAMTFDASAWNADSYGNSWRTMTPKARYIGTPTNPDGQTIGESPHLGVVALTRVDKGVQDLIARDTTHITLEDTDIAAIAELVASRLGDTLADKVADKIAARMKE